MPQTLQPAALLAGRILLSIIFVLSGFTKITGYAGTQQYMEMFGVPGALLPLVIATEFGLGLALVVGFKTRLAAIGLAGFTIIAGFIFHSNFADQMQMIMFLKNLAITGGLLALATSGAGAWSLDGRLGTAPARVPEPA
ncbi:MAG: DoxX family protein [Rhodobiaceae bacterium]|nr:DoxX family protein [Rhodobiaceae bacterium]